jgi:hypothetical protein
MNVNKVVTGKAPVRPRCLTPARRLATEHRTPTFDACKDCGPGSLTWSAASWGIVLLTWWDVADTPTGKGHRYVHVPDLGQPGPSSAMGTCLQAQPKCPAPPMASVRQVSAAELDV